MDLSLGRENHAASDLEEEEASMRKLFAVVLVALCTWYAKQVLTMVDTVIGQLTRFIH